MKKVNDVIYLSKKEAAEYLDLPTYVLTTLDRIGRMSADKRIWFTSYYAKKKLDDYKRDANVERWNHDAVILKKLRHQKTAF